MKLVLENHGTKTSKQVRYATGIIKRILLIRLKFCLKLDLPVVLSHWFAHRELYFREHLIRNHFQ